MDRHWKTFFLLMMVVLASIIGITYGVSVWQGSGFWESFYPQFFATTFGVIVTAMLTYAVWLRQQKHAKRLQRRELLDDLKFEVSENLKWLANLKTFLDDPSRPQYTSLDRGLNTVTMKYALNPENLVLLKNFDLADGINRIVGHCEEWNNNYHKRFRQYLIQEAVATGELYGQQQRARIAFGVEAGSDVGFIGRMLEELMKKLEMETTHTSDTLTS